MRWEVRDSRRYLGRHAQGFSPDAAPLYRDAPEAQEAWASGDCTLQVFMQEALPNASQATRALAGDLITATLSAVGKHFSESPQSPAEIEAYAEAMADMFCDYLKGFKEQLRSDFAKANIKSRDNHNPPSPHRMLCKFVSPRNLWKWNSLGNVEA
jgi:hypothetical protein